MYEEFYQFTAEPFRLTRDDGFRFFSRGYGIAKERLLGVLTHGEGLALLIGEAGVGKTTLLNEVMGSLRLPGTTVANLVSTQITGVDLLRLLAAELGIQDMHLPHEDLRARVERALMLQYQAHRRTLVLVDEAQSLPADGRLELYWLCAQALKPQRNLQVVLVGTPSLLEAVNRVDRGRVRDCWVVHIPLLALEPDETQAYIRCQLLRVGWDGDPELAGGVGELLQRVTHGIPRLINLVCARLLLRGALEEQHRLEPRDVRIVVDELRQEIGLPFAPPEEFPALSEELLAPELRAIDSACPDASPCGQSPSPEQPAPHPDRRSARR